MRVKNRVQLESFRAEGFPHGHPGELASEAPHCRRPGFADTPSRRSCEWSAVRSARNLSLCNQS